MHQQVNTISKTSKNPKILSLTTIREQCGIQKQERNSKEKSRDQGSEEDEDEAVSVNSLSMRATSA